MVPWFSNDKVLKMFSHIYLKSFNVLLVCIGHFEIKTLKYLENLVRGHKLLGIIRHKWSESKRHFFFNKRHLGVASVYRAYQHVHCHGWCDARDVNRLCTVRCHYDIDLSRLVGKPTMWFPNRSDIDRPVQAQKRARSLKFRIYVEEELYYLSE